MNFFPNLQIHFHMNPLPPTNENTQQSVSRQDASRPSVGQERAANPLLNAITSMIRQSLNPDEQQTRSSSVNDIHFYVSVDPQSSSSTGLTVQELNESTHLRVVNDNDAVLCSICQNRISSQTIIREIQVCHHIFHPECIDEWLVQHETCPVCRANLIPQEEKRND